MYLFLAVLPRFMSVTLLIAFFFTVQTHIIRLRRYTALSRMVGIDFYIVFFSVV